jgi:hypothetical protein
VPADSQDRSHFFTNILLFLAATVSLSAATLVIRDVTLIDATGAPARPHMSITVTGERITTITPALSARVPAGAQVIEGKGKFLIPGLWDMHVHLWEKQNLLPLYVANGVTGIRDMGSDFTKTAKWRKDIANGTIIGPRIFTSGPAVMGPDLSAGKLSVIRITTPADGEHAASVLDDQNVDFIKVLSNVPHDAYISLAYRARLLRLPFAGPLPDSVTMDEAIDARQRSMEHLFGLPLACSSQEVELRRRRAEAVAAKDYPALENIAEKIYQSYDETKAAGLFRRFVRFDVWQVPNLTRRERMSLIDVDQLTIDARQKYIPAAIRKTWTQDDPREDLKKASPADLERGKRDFARCLELVGAMHRAGVPMLAGTDTGDPYVLPGFALHDELALLVRAGMTPLEAIQSSTRNPARFLGMETTLGTIQKGKIADMVLLNANPLSDIRNTRQVAAVILKGRLLTSERLNGLLRSMEAVK